MNRHIIYVYLFCRAPRAEVKANNKPDGHLDYHRWKPPIRREDRCRSICRTHTKMEICRGKKKKNLVQKDELCGKLFRKRGHT